MTYRDQKGNILLSSLLILVAMNMLGAGILQNASKESTLATFKTVDSEVHHVTESCTQDVITYFEGLTQTPSTVAVISQDDLDFLMTGTESTRQQNKLSGYSYTCTTTYITTKSVSAGTGTGSEIGSTGSEYGGTGGTVIKDYYQIVATGQGPSSSRKVLNTLISVSYE